MDLNRQSALLLLAIMSSLLAVVAFEAGGVGLSGGSWMALGVVFVAASLLP